MKRLKSLFIALILTLSLAACGNQQNGAAALPTSSADALQGDAGPTDNTEDGLRILEQEPEEQAGTTEKSNTNARSDEHISVDVAAKNAYVLNVDTDSVLYQKNSSEHIAPASTAKLLTALTALDYCLLSDTVTVGSEIDLIASDSSKAGLQKGDILTGKQLLEALLLPSGNDAAYTLAVQSGKRIADDEQISVSQAIQLFVDAMNKKAADLGAASSCFKNPDGYDADGQYTSAFDLAQIAKACLENNKISEIVRNFQIRDTLVNGREVTYQSTNELLNPISQYYYSKAIGLKTGSTGNAGSCLISAAYIDGQTYLCVIMGSSSGVRFSDSLTVFSAIDPSISLEKEIKSGAVSAPGVPDIPSGGLAGS